MLINLSSTSYLLEKNNNWNYLHTLKSIKFSKYGDIFSLEKSDNISTNINLIFLSDIINFETAKKYSVEQKKINHILKKIKTNLAINQKPIIVGISSYFYNNIIESAQNLNIYKKLKFFFLEQLYKFTEKNKNLYIFDIDEIFSLHGIEKCFDNRNYYLSRCRISSLGIEIIAKSLRKLIERINYPNKKVLLLDCDNTLWGGVIAEDGISKIRIGDEGEGLAFLDFQKAIKKLKNQGVIIILVSKNIKEDVIKVIKEHRSMILKEKDISAFKINWLDKSKNIQDISTELNLNMDSFVFWDDNPIEREKVRIRLKDVEVIEPDADVSNWPKQLLEYDKFSKFSITKNDYNRTKQYQIRHKFLTDKKDHKNEIDYLKSIKIKLKIVKINNGNIDRAVQMCQRTNQFNLSNKRYNHDDITNLNKKRDKCFMIHMKDMYGDHGIISLVCLKFKPEKILLLDTFLMSCRVLGRYAENWILSEILKVAKKNKIKKLIAEFIPTKKNDIAKNFLIENNFKKILTKNKTKFNSIYSNKKTELFLYNSKEKIKFLKVYA